MSTFGIHTLLLLLSVGLTYAWTKNPNLSSFNLQAVGFIVICYFLIRFNNRRSRLTLIVDGTIFTILTLLLVISTGGLQSPIFFLFYFLLFAISLLFEPLQSALLAISLVFIFLPQPWSQIKDVGVVNLVTLISITPLSVVFGKKYLDTLEALGEIKILKKIVQAQAFALSSPPQAQSETVSLPTVDDVKMHQPDTK